MASEWTKRALFCEWIADAKAVLGAKSVIPVAEAMGIAYNSLKKYTSMVPGNKHVPGDDKLKALGDLLERDWRMLKDDPGVAPSGISQAVWHQADEDARTWANIMFHEGKTMSPEMRKKILEMVRLGKEIGKQRQGSGD